MSQQGYFTDLGGAPSLMEEPVHNPNSQFDRIEAKLDSFLDRLTRVEERQTSQLHRLESQAGDISGHEYRIKEMEILLAVHRATGTEISDSLRKRWAMLGAVCITLLGAFGSLIASTLSSLFK